MAWASLSTDTLQSHSRASSTSSSGGSWRSGRQLISTAVSKRAQAANTISASKADGGRPPPTTLRLVQWPRMSTWGLATAATIRRVMASESMRSLE